MSALVVVAGAGWASEAGAYCRTTTCELSEPSCALDASGCSTEGEYLAWQEPCLRYAVQQDGSASLGLDAATLEELLAEAFAAWQSVDCGAGETPGFSAQLVGRVACNEQQLVCGGAAENVSVVMFQDEKWPANYPSSAAALTSVIGDLNSGAIIDADLEINSSSYQFYWQDGAEAPEGALDLRRVLLHEVGHYLGLSHSMEDGAIMSLAYEQLSSAALSADDIAGICAIFPPRVDGLQCEPSAAVESSCGEGASFSEGACEETPATGVSRADESRGCSMAGGRAGSGAWGWLALGLLGGVSVMRRRRSVAAFR